MKLAILSDFHLGYERFSEDAFKQALQAMVLATAEADALLLPGDLFDTKIPKPESIAQALEVFRVPLARHWDARIVSFSARDNRQNVCQAPVIAIHGTHEMRAKSLINPVQLLEKGGFIANAHGATVVIEKNGEKVAISGMGGVPEKQAKAAVEALDFKPVPGAFNILMFHQSLRDLLPVGEDHLGIDDLPDGFDLYVCGHMHKSMFKRFGSKLIAIPGSTVVTQLKKEEEEAKGLCVFDTATRNCEFRSIASRPFFYREIELKDAGADEAVAAARSAIGEMLASNPANPIIRLKLKGTLRKGVPPSALSFTGLAAEFEGKALLSIDRAMESPGLEGKVRELRTFREKGASARERGMEILQEKLKEKGFALNVDVASLFEMLSSGKRGAADSALNELLKAA